MIRDINITAKQCTCDVCGYKWLSFVAEVPESCRSRKCRSRQWDGKKKPSGVKIQLPAPRKRGRPRSIALIDVSREE
jgi:hypothetical protein